MTMSNLTTQQPTANDSAPPTYVLFIFGVCLLAGIVRTLSRWTFLHHTVIMFGLGALFGYLSKTYASINVYLNLEFVSAARLLQMHAFVLPVVILEYVFSMDPRVFLSCTGKAIAAAVLDYLLTLFLHGAFVLYLLSFYPSISMWAGSNSTHVALIWIVIGSLTNVTDTSYVVNTFYKMGSYWVLVKLLQIKRIIALVGACAVYILVIYLDEHHFESHWIYYVTFLLIQIFASTVLGWLAAHITIWWIRRLYNDTAVEMTIALAVAYLVYYFGAANTGQKPFISAISVVVYALLLNNQRNCFSLGLDTFLHQLLHILVYVVKTVMFTIIGFLITTEDFTQHKLLMFQSDILVTFTLYCYCMIARAIGATALYPLLRRAGWKLSWQEMAVSIFCNVSGTVCIIIAVATCNESLVDLFFNDRHLQYILMFHLGLLAVIRSIIAGTLFRHVLKVLGMRHVSLSRYVAMTDALRKIQDQMKTAARSYKYDRFLADADWETVYRFTNFEDPYKNISRYSVIGPAMNLDSDLLGDTRLNLLHAQKISFWRQYEQGLLSLRALRILLEECNLAEAKVTTDSYDIADQIRKHYAKKSSRIFGFVEKLKNKFEHEQEVRHTIINEILDTVKNPGRRKLTKVIVSNVVVESFMVLFVILIAIVAVIMLVYESQCTGGWNVSAMDVFYYELNIAFVATFTVYIILKLVFFKWRYLLLFGSIFNVSLVIVGWIEIGLAGLLLNPEETCTVMVATGYAVTVRLVFHKLFIAHRLLRLGVLVEDKTNILITLMKKGMLVQLQLGYDVGKGYVYCKEDVQQYASEVIAQPDVLSTVQSELRSSRVQMMKELATVQKKFPGIVVSVKSQEACRRILNAANELVSQMRKNGRVDSNEAEMLEEMIKLRLKGLAKIPAQIEMPSVDMLISKLPWVDGDEMLLRFLNFNSKLFNMAEGETVDFDSDPTAGLYVLVSGLIRVNWVIGEPYKELVQTIHSGSEGTLLTTYKQSVQHDYMTTGSTFGELALLTEKQILIDAVCETTVLMFHVQYESIRTALDWIKEPPLEWRLWQLAAVRVSFPLLKALPGYFNKMSMEDLKVLIDHGTLIVQHLEGEFHDSTNEEVVDPGRYLSTVIVLVHGTANTESGETFEGPIVIPPNSEELIFSSMLCDLYVLYLVPQKPTIASVGFTISASDLSTQGLSTMKDSASQLAAPTRSGTHKKRGRVSQSTSSGQKLSDVRVMMVPTALHQDSSPTLTMPTIGGEDTDKEPQLTSATRKTTPEGREEEEKHDDKVNDLMMPSIGMYSHLSFKPDKSAKAASAASTTPTSSSPERSPTVGEGQISPDKPKTLPTSDPEHRPTFSAQSSPDAPEAPQILRPTKSPLPVTPPSSPDSPVKSLKSTTVPIREEEANELELPRASSEPKVASPEPKAASHEPQAPLESKEHTIKLPTVQAPAAPREELNVKPRKATSEVSTRQWTDAWRYVAPEIKVTFGGLEKYRSVASPIMAKKPENQTSASTRAAGVKASTKTEEEKSNKNANNATNGNDSNRSEKVNLENWNNSGCKLAPEEERKPAAVSSTQRNEPTCFTVAPQFSTSFQSNQSAVSGDVGADLEDGSNVLRFPAMNKRSVSVQRQFDEAGDSTTTSETMSTTPVSTRSMENVVMNVPSDDITYHHHHHIDDIASSELGLTGTIASTLTHAGYDQTTAASDSTRLATERDGAAGDDLNGECQYLPGNVAPIAGRSVDNEDVAISPASSELLATSDDDHMLV